MKKLLLHTGQKLRFLSVFLCFLLCFPSCSYTKKDPLEYRSRGFRATVSVELESFSFDAVFHISPPDSEGGVSFKVDFISPNSLSGLSVVQSRDNFKILLDGKEYISENSTVFSELDIGRAVTALSPTEPVRSIKSNGEHTIVSVGDYTIYIDPDTSLPIKSVNESLGLTVTVHELVFN